MLLLREKRLHCVMPFFTQFANPLAYGERVNAGEVKWKAPKIRPQRENEPQSRRGGVFSKITAEIFAFAKRFA